MNAIPPKCYTCLKSDVSYPGDICAECVAILDKYYSDEPSTPTTEPQEAA